MPITVLGGLDISTAEGKPVRLATRKTALVFALLALNERAVPRAQLAEWVWPDRSAGQAKTSLRQALAAIRRTLPSIAQGCTLVAEADGVRLAGGDDQIDVRQFEALAPATERPAVVRAARLYGGELLDGVELGEAVEPAVRAHRARLRHQALVLVEALSGREDLSSEERGACEALANRLLVADEAAEEAHRAIARLRLAEGQTNAARRQLATCLEAVARVLGAEPELKTKALLDRLRQRAETMPAPAAADAEPQRGAGAHRSAPRHVRPSVVVMPFDDLGAGPDDFFADGVVEEITSALSRVKDFLVIARQTAFIYKGKFVDVREVGRDLDVRYAIEGTVRRGGERVRINVQLVETQTGAQLWSDRYEGERAELFDLQDRIASHVAGAINPSIRASEIELAKRTPPEDLQAYDLVLRALPHFWAHRKEDNQTALDLLTAALERNPAYGVAQAFKAWCHAQHACYLWAEDPGGERARAIATADEAARNVVDHSTALVAIGAAYSMTTTDQELAASFIDRSLALDANNAWGWMRAGWLKVLFTQRDDALACFERARTLSPFDPFTFNVYFGMAAAHAEQGDYAKAIELAERGLRAGPGVTWAYRMLASYYKLAGEDEKSAAALRTLMHHYPDLTIAKMKQGLPPSLELTNPQYWDGMRKAGIPDG